MWCLWLTLNLYLGNEYLKCRAFLPIHILMKYFIKEIISFKTHL